MPFEAAVQGNRVGTNFHRGSPVGIAVQSPLETSTWRRQGRLSLLKRYCTRRISCARIAWALSYSRCASRCRCTVKASARKYKSLGRSPVFEAAGRAGAQVRELAHLRELRSVSWRTSAHLGISVVRGCGHDVRYPPHHQPQSKQYAALCPCLLLAHHPAVPHPCLLTTLPCHTHAAHVHTSRAFSTARPPPARAAPHTHARAHARQRTVP
jgi:hypothetical protein